MASGDRPAPRVFFDSSVLIAGAFSSSGASFILLQLADLGLLDGRISPTVREEVSRNLRRKLPGALPALQALMKESLVEGPSPPDEQLKSASDLADPKDVVILASALDQSCQYLVTLNERDFWPSEEQITVLRPGELLRRLRSAISELDAE